MYFLPRQKVTDRDYEDYFHGKPENTIIQKYRFPEKWKTGYSQLSSYWFNGYDSNIYGILIVSHNDHFNDMTKSILFTRFDEKIHD